MTLTISGTGSSASCGRSLARGSPSSPLLGSPIELIIPPASSHSRGGGLPCARLERDRLGDERARTGSARAGRRRTRARAAIASNVPGAVDDPVRERGCRRTRSRTVRRQLDCDADCRRRTARDVSRRAGRGRRSRSTRRTHRPCRTPARAGPGTRGARCRAAATGLEHRRRSARRTPRCRRSIGRARSVTRPWWPAEPSSVATPRAGDQRGALGVGRVAEAEQQSPRPPSASLQIASGAIPTPPPTSTGRALVARRREAVAERAEQRAGRRPRASSHRRVGAGPDVLEQKVEACRLRALRMTENARGRNGRSSSPPPQRSAAVSM